MKSKLPSSSWVSLWNLRLIFYGPGGVSIRCPEQSIELGARIACGASRLPESSQILWDGGSAFNIFFAQMIHLYLLQPAWPLPQKGTWETRSLIKFIGSKPNSSQIKSIFSALSRWHATHPVQSGVSQVPRPLSLKCLSNRLTSVPTATVQVLSSV